jgi:hypothetical protein
MLSRTVLDARLSDHGNLRAFLSDSSAGPVLPEVRSYRCLVDILRLDRSPSKQAKLYRLAVIGCDWWTSDV